MIKLLACDLDGTLLRGDLSISGRTVRSLKEAMAKGLKFAFATGRMFMSARQFSEAMGLDIPIICCIGSLIKRSSDGEVLYYKTFDSDMGERIVDFLWNNDVIFQSYSKDEMLVPAYSPHVEWYSSRYGVACKVSSNLDDFKAYPPAKIMVIEPPDRIEGVRSAILSEFKEGVKTMRSDVNMMEVMAGESSKGVALNYLAEMLDIGVDETMAVGDSENDLDMLLRCGHPVVVANAMDSLKKVAKMFVSSNEEDGVAEAIERYILPQF